MILAAIEIDNYKQYAGERRIEFPEQGMIAITGPNGAGKTTLFEAIEWCLYGPRTIPLATIPPHGGVGKTAVRVTLEDPSDGRRYVVQRELRSGITRAEVFTEDQPGQAIVQGARDVSDHVAKTLIGLPHGAFVSTFFTRQKELTFFGDLSPTDRRVEVARLLGFQTIREAQNELATERTSARQLATSLRTQYERESRDRDFTAETAAAEAAVEQSGSDEAAAIAVAKEAETQAEQSREALEHWRGKQEEDAALDRELVRLTGEIAAAEAGRVGAEAELRRLALRGEERIGLLPLADAVEKLQFEVKLLEEQRLRAEQLRTLEETRGAATERLVRIAGQLKKVVEEHAGDAEGLVAWGWSRGDEARPEDAAARVRQAAATVDPGGARARVESLLRAQGCARTATGAESSSQKLRRHFDALVGERQALLEGGDPHVALAEAEGEERRARDGEQAARQARTAARTAREELARILGALRAHSGEAICPTCARPLGRSEVETISSVLERDIARLQGDEAAAARDIAVAESAIAAAKQAQATANERRSALSVLEGRLDDGRGQIETAEAAVRDCLADRELAFRGAGITTEPGDAEIVAARHLADRTQRIAGLQPLIAQLGEQAGDSRRTLTEAEASIAELGPVTYDAGGHRQALDELAASRTARIQIEQIDKEIASRERYERQRDSAAEAMVVLEARRQRVTTERAEVGFDAEALAAARAAEAATRGAAHAARTALGVAREVNQQAQSALRRIVEERDRLRQLAAESDRANREADELERMVREFAEFDRYVADRVGPLLAETTERLLSQVTEGKYDRVRFDENYGIAVYDGDEAFDLTGFSGGERDVVSLCARLAMSELVGSAASRPPRFLVLDEVFGSLDSERRAQLLGTLGSLASSGHFQQVFIISHVDDVQQSHVMDEAWTIEERDGVSHVMRPTAALVEVC